MLSVAFSPDGSRIASGSDDDTIRIWNMRTRAATGQPLEGHDGTVTSVVFSRDGSLVYSASYDQTIRVSDVKAGKAVGYPLRGHASVVRCIALSPDEKHIASGSWDNTIRIWDAQAFSQEPASQCIIGPDGQMEEIDDEGWVRNKDGNPLLWIPDDIRGDAFSPSLVRIPRREGNVGIEIDWDKLCAGERWTSIFNPPH